MGKLPIPKTALKPIPKSLVTFAGYNLLFGVAHLGGLLTGLGLGAVLSKSITEPPPLRVRWRNYATVGVALLLLAGNSYLRQKTGEAESTALLQDPMQAFKHGNFGQAIPGLKQAVERAPNSPQKESQEAFQKADEFNRNEK
jgi:hypothetical protein